VKVVANNGYAGSATSFKLSGDNAFAQFARLGNHNKISFTVKADIQGGDNDKRKLFGISFVRGGDSKKYYTIVVNREGDITDNQETGRKINFEEEGAEGKGFIEGIDGYLFTRPANDIYNVTIYTDNSVLTMYINDVCAYTQRIYGMAKNCWSINNYGVNIDVTDLTVSQY
jgi:beta-fructofuranosidase